MATATKNALTTNFYRRFHKYMKRTYMIDGRKAYTLHSGILGHEPYVPRGNLFDAIVEEWRARIPRKADGHPADEPHRLVPLTYTFLKDLERRDRYAPDAEDDEAPYWELRVFSILPMKRGFECSHMKMCQLGLLSLLKRAGYAILARDGGWDDVRDQYWHRPFNIRKFETANRKFAGEILTDGKAVTIIMRKPKKDTSPPRTYSEVDFDLVWGLDPGRRGVFVATNQFEETVECSTKEFFEEVHCTKSNQKIRGWQDRNPRVLEAIRDMPTKKTASLKTLQVYIAFVTQHMDLLLGFSRLKPFRRLRLNRFIFMKKKLRQLCEELAPAGKRVIIGSGDWSNQDVGGFINRSPAGPVKVFERELAGYCTVIPVSEYRTSKVHYDCTHELKNQYSQ